MRIALDARSIYAQPLYRKSRNLINLYQTLSELRPHWHVCAYHRQAEPEKNILPHGFATPIRVGLSGSRFETLNRWRLPMMAWRDEATILHCSANLYPFWKARSTVVTIHDLLPFDIPLDHPAKEVARFEHSVRTACHRATHLICPSRYIANRLVHDFGANPQHITVNHWAPDPTIRQIDESEYQPVLDRYGIHQPFVLHFGSTSKRNNTQKIIKAWAMLEPRLRREQSLLIVGLDQHARDETKRLANTLGVDVHISSFTTTDDMPSLLSAANILAYPSLAEGFGIPILNGWVTSTAVLTSNITSLPEIAGDAALTVDPTDVFQIAGGLHELMTNRSLCHRLINNGRHRASMFSWRATAQRFANVLENAAGLFRPRSLAA